MTDAYTSARMAIAQKRPGTRVKEGLELNTSVGSSFAAPGPLTFSIVMVTFARDRILKRAIDRIAVVIGDRRDVEFILVDNNPDTIERTTFIEGFELKKYVKIGENIGVRARNNGAAVAEARFVLFVDDDDMLFPDDALVLYERAFRENPSVAIVTARVIDQKTGDTPRKVFPHTNKRLPHGMSRKTFRFQGSGFAIVRHVMAEIGPMSEDYFYGLEEIDYAYRIIEAGHEILYEPAIWVLMFEDLGGRVPLRQREEMRLTNKLIISYKYLPVIYFVPNIILFSAYVFVLNRGRINPFRSFKAFTGWLSTNRQKRMPVGKHALDYIRACGGHVWK
jgi:GT2 family glycosyltransferase